MYIMVCNVTEGVKLGSLLQVLSSEKRNDILMYRCSGVNGNIVLLPHDHCIIVNDQQPLTADLSSFLRALLSIALWSNSLSTSFLEGNREKATEVTWKDIFWNLLPPSSRTIPMNWVIMSAHNTAGIELLYNLTDARTKDLLTKRSTVFQRFSANEEFLSYLFAKRGNIPFSTGIRSMVRRKTLEEFAVLNDRRSAVVVNHEESGNIGAMGIVCWGKSGLHVFSNGEVIPVKQKDIVVTEEADTFSLDTSILVKLKVLSVKHSINLSLQGGKPLPKIFLDRFVQMLTPSECKTTLARILYTGLARGALRFPSLNLWLSGAVLSGIEHSEIFEDLVLDDAMIEAKRGILSGKRALTKYYHEDN